MTWLLSEKAHPDWQKAWEQKHKAERKTKSASLRWEQMVRAAGLF